MSRTMTVARMAIGAMGATILSVAVARPPEIATADPWNGAPTRLVLTAPPRLPDALDTIRRDPFEGGPPDPGTTSTTSPATSTNSPQSSEPVVPPAPIYGAVPNPGAPTIPGFPGSGPGSVPNPGSLVPQGGNAAENVTVVGTVVGGDRPPVAMISDGSHLDFAHVGDSISGKKISSIVTQGIEFSDGSRVAVSGETNSPNTQSATSGTPTTTGTAQQAPQLQDTSSSGQGQNVKVTPRSANGANQPTYQNPSDARPQTNPFDTISGDVPPTITPGNYPLSGPPTLSPGMTPPPLPRYVPPTARQSTP